MTITTEQPNEIDNKTGDGWQSELDAIRRLNRIDVELLTLSHRDSREHLLELRRAMAVVQESLAGAEKCHAAIDGQISEVSRLVALVKSTAENDRNFQSIYGDDISEAIQRVKQLSRLAE